MDTKLAKWGNSIGVRLPKEIVARASLSSGDEVSVAVEKGGRIVLTPKRPGITLTELLERITPETLHATVDWGPPTGKEAW